MRYENTDFEEKMFLKMVVRGKGRDEMSMGLQMIMRGMYNIKYIEIHKDKERNT